jgi:peptidoglycan/LPS O-acetylase OafA/YrhL
VLLFGLSAVWMYSPELMLTQWGVQYSDGAGLVSRRAAAFYAGIALMLMLARNAEPSKARFAVATGVSLACLILATLGILEWQSGSATAEILVAVCLESVLAVAFLLSSKAK